MESLQLSKNSVKGQIGLMSEDILDQILEVLKQISGKYFWQMDGFMNIPGCLQLMVFLRFKREDNWRNFSSVALYQLPLEKASVIWGKAFFLSGWPLWLCALMEHHLWWEVMWDLLLVSTRIIHLFTCGRAVLSMLVNWNLNDAIQIMNFIKAKPFNSHIFWKKCVGRWDHIIKTYCSTLMSIGCLEEKLLH